MLGQKAYATAIGFAAGLSSQGQNSVAIGTLAGESNQGKFMPCIGTGCRTD